MTERSITALRADWKPSISHNPIIGIFGVLFGALLVTLNSRITSLGLADVRGALHAGFDEGAWIPTAHTVGQMLICGPTVWAGLVYGPRKILMIASATVFVVSLLIPVAGSLAGILCLQLVSGLAMGTFLPLTVSFVARNLPPKYLVFGLAAYGLNLEFSQNISASIEGFYLDYLSWKWIFWQNAFLAVIVFALVDVGMPKRSPESVPAAQVDRQGMLFFSLSFSLLYAVLDQGDRLDWFNSGLIIGLSGAALLLFICFIVNSLVSPRPWLNIRFFARSNIADLALLVTFFRFGILSVAFLIPQYLSRVQGYRGLQIGDVLLLIALPQILLAPLIALVLRYIDPRIATGIGFWLIGMACISVSGSLTPFWASADFMPSQIIQAIGQSLALISLLTYNLQFVRLEEALTFGTVLQTARLMGGQIGAAFVGTYARIREQVHSNLLGIHVASGDRALETTIGQGASIFGKFGLGEAIGRSTILLSSSVQKQAYVLAYIDCFVLIGAVMFICLMIILFLRPVPAHSAAKP